MEGVGSRLGRASSRYGAAPVFSGPVRKWKKQWVHVSSSTLSYRGNLNANGNNTTPTLLLCRWTPISSSADSDNSSSLPEEPPRRKFRYTPVVELEEKKKGNRNKPDELTKGNIDTISATRNSVDVFRKLKKDGPSMEEAQGLNKSHLELDLRLKGLDDDYNSDDENKEASLGRTSSGDLSRQG